MKAASGVFVKGAREHNLKNIDVHIPRNRITVITGLSGSGKSSLAFDTIYAEGQRRYVESLSAYARNFLEQMKKPEVDSVTGLSPAISIEQKTTSTNPRSTVGTVTEIYDFLRLLYAKVGRPVCPNHRTSLSGQTREEILDEILKAPPGSKIHLFAPVVRAKKGEFHNEFEKWLKQGYIRARIDGELRELESVGRLVKTKVHDIDLLIDRLILKPEMTDRLSESLESALNLADGYVTVQNLDSGTEKTYSRNLACGECGFNFPEIEPRLLSFNNPKGACETCKGLGTLDYSEEEISSAAEDGEDDSGSAVDDFALRPCPDCVGFRINLAARSLLLGGLHIGELSRLPVGKLLEFIKVQKWSSRQAVIVEKLVRQLESRLRILNDLGVGYLSLERSVRTLSGGESQRIRLGTQLGSALIGVLYVLDEPSIGLHARDQSRLLQAIRNLRDRGNTVILVEHDEETILSADKVIDLGPRAGRLGGEILCEGTPEEVRKDPKSITGKYLRRQLSPVLHRNRTPSDKKLLLGSCTGNNLKSVDLSLPLGVFTSVTGVSGSGKSTLVVDTLYRVLSNHFNKSSWTVPSHGRVEGLQHLTGVVDINQKPIGRTPRSNPATYVGLFSAIRELYSQIPESRMRGYGPGRFSFNVKGGRCESCQGAGQIRMEMHFLAEVFVPCDVCLGLRYNRETLMVRYKDKSIADVLAMSVEEAADFFANHKKISVKLETLKRVGLDYIHLGQSSTTLSGGEAQRVKLSRELSKRSGGHTLYILDEPTTGLHFEDTKKLLELLHELVDQGNSVVVIEHNLDVIRSSDWIIDLGPEGGEAGGKIVAQGPPDVVKKSPKSLTGKYI